MCEELLDFDNGGKGMPVDVEELDNGSHTIVISLACETPSGVQQL